MKNKGLILSLFILLLSTDYSVAQTPQIDLMTAESYIQIDEYLLAAPYLENIVNNDSLVDEHTLARAKCYLGVCYINNYDKRKGLSLLKEVFTPDQQFESKVMYWMGQANHMTYDFDNAVKYYQMYLDTIIIKKNKREIKQHKEEVELFIKQAQYAKAHIDDEQNFIIENLGGTVNSAYSEHSPIISESGNMLIYTSRKPKDSTSFMQSGGYLEAMWKTERGTDGKWQTPNFLMTTSRDNNPLGKIKVKDHISAIQLYDHDTKMLLYKSTKKGDLYVSELQADGWSEPESLGNEINSKEFDSDGFIANNGNTIYFSTNSHNKDGNLDIYVINKDTDGNWGESGKVPIVNSNNNEIAPFLFKDGKSLIFCSDRAESFGGYDVFRADYDEATSTWGTPKNLGYPINTPDNDVYFYLDNKDSIAFISTHRDSGHGEKDIYQVTPVYRITLKGTLIDSYGEGPVNVNTKVGFTATTDRGETKFVTPDEDGIFDISVLSQSDYLLSILYRGDTIRKEITTTPFAKRDNEVHDKEYILNIPTYDIKFAGTVMDELTKEPVPQISMSIEGSGTPSKPIVLDKTGKYTTSLRSQQAYMITMVNEGDTIMREEFVIPAMADNESLKIKNFLLPLPLFEVAYSGTVTDIENDDPVPYAKVKFISEDGSFEQVVTASSKGEYSIDLPSNVDYTIEMYKKGSILLTEQLSVPVARQDTVAIAQNFTVSSKLLNNLIYRVTVYDEASKQPAGNLEIVLASTTEEDANKTSKTLRDGSFTMILPSNSSYIMSVVKDADTLLSQLISMPIAQTKNQQLDTAVYVKLPASAIYNVMLTGTVLNEITQLPIDDIAMQVMRMDNKQKISSVLGDVGGFEMSLSNASYRIDFVKDGDTLLTDLVSIPLSLEEGQSIVKNYIIPPTQEEIAVAMLARNEYVIKGTVFDEATKQPLANSSVKLFGIPGMTQLVETDHKGNYVLSLDTMSNMTLNCLTSGYYRKEVAVSDSSFSDENLFVYNFSLKQIDDTDLEQFFMIVYFNLDSAGANNLDGNETFDNLLAMLAKQTETNLTIAGYTDSSGPDAYNKWLSQKRAEFVLQKMVNYGIAEKRLTAIGYGEENPREDNSTREGRIKNRRVEFFIDNPEQ